MSDDQKNTDPEEKLPEVKKPASAVPKRNPINPFNKPNKFISPKSGNPGNKGGGFQKGGSMKKGK